MDGRLLRITTAACTSLEATQLKPAEDGSKINFLPLSTRPNSFQTLDPESPRGLVSFYGNTCVSIWTGLEGLPGGGRAGTSFTRATDSDGRD